MKKQWLNYLKDAEKRLGKDSESELSVRSQYQRDFDRVVFSSTFRRLQNKTQVLPLPKSDYVRNRLTHSLETASVGRSLGNIVGERVLEKHPEIKKQVRISSFDFGYMVSAACLAHDIGNPPFGHAGEDAISHYFTGKDAEKFIRNFSDKEKEDLQKFEGNSAGFRLLAQTLQSLSEFQGGLNLTYGTYGSFMKYPKESLPKRKIEGKASLKKYGVFQTEMSQMEKIAQKLNLIEHENTPGNKAWKRFPLAFLVEAADDLCYTIIDYEDGFNIGLISFEEITAAFTNILELTGNQAYKTKLKKIKDKRSQINYLRSVLINELIFKISEVFMENEQAIVKGEFDSPLMDCLANPVKNALSEINRSSIDKVYQSETVLKIESAGFQVVPYLLHTFIAAVLGKHEYKGQKQILKILPNQYKCGDTDYEKALNITMFVSGMTDRYAVELYKNLKGIELAGY